MTTRNALLSMSLCLSVLAGCSHELSRTADLGDGGANDGGASDLVSVDLTPMACSSVGASECLDGGRRRLCQQSGDTLAWSTPIACGADEACRDGACTTPSATQTAQVAALAEMVDQMAAVTSYPYPYDPVAIKATGALEIIHGGDSESAYLAAMWHAFLAMPEGHQGMQLDSGCGSKLPYQYSSRYGVCGRQDPSGVVVTFARAGNGLGLQPGEKIVAADGVAGEAMLAEIYRRPVCGSSFPSQSGQRDAAAAAFFGVITPGSILRVAAVDGTERDVVVPTKKDAALSCGEVFGRTRQTIAEATTLPDGTAVIRVPSWVPYDVPFPTDPDAIEGYVADFQARIKTEFDKVKTAPRLIWDVRGNGGGMTRVGLAIASGMPGAQSTLATHCVARLADSSPPAFDTFAYAEYALTPGGDFLYGGKVAVLIDGLGYSATDYFAHFVRHATSAVVIGSPTAGGYGGTSGSFVIDSTPPSLTFDYDVNKCVATADGTPLEGNAAPPTMTVYYDPADLASGRDTLLEAAIAALQ